MRSLIRQGYALVTSSTRTRIAPSPTGAILEWTLHGVKVHDENKPRAKPVTAECTRLSAGIIGGAAPLLFRMLLLPRSKSMAMAYASWAGQGVWRSEP